MLIIDPTYILQYKRLRFIPGLIPNAVYCYLIPLLSHKHRILVIRVNGNIMQCDLVKMNDVKKSRGICFSAFKYQ